MDIKMTLIECPNCHMVFAISDTLNNALKHCHNTFYCPQGHTMSYPQKSDLDIARAKIDQLQADYLALLDKQKKPKRKAKVKN